MLGEDALFDADEGGGVVRGIGGADAKRKRLLRRSGGGVGVGAGAGAGAGAVV
jgi:hypothetical protein